MNDLSFVWTYIPPQLQDLVFFLAEIPGIALYPFLLAVDILLSGSTTISIWFISAPHTHHWFYIICNLQKSGLCPIFQVIYKDLNSAVAPGVQHWLPSGLFAAHHNPLFLAHQPVFNPPHCTYITHTSSACLWRCYSSVKSLPDEDEVINTHCSPLSHQAGLLIYWRESGWLTTISTS